MYFLINPKDKKVRKTRKRSRRAKVARRRVRRTQRQTQSGKGTAMATRRRRRRRRHAVATPRRRRRRRSVVTIYRANPRRRSSRRRRVTHRRRYRRNPGGTGVLATIKNGAIDGTLVLVGGAVQGRVAGFVAKVVPLSGLPGVLVSDVGSAVAVTMLARKFLPGRARMVSAGAFANAVRRVVTAVSPTAGALLGDGEQIGGGMPIGGLYEAGALNAYPEQQMGAYPGGGLGDTDDNMNGAYLS